MLNSTIDNGTIIKSKFHDGCDPHRSTTMMNLSATQLCGQVQSVNRDFSFLLPALLPSSNTTTSKIITTPSINDPVKTEGS